MRISDWSSDVCSSDLRDVIIVARDLRADAVGRVPAGEEGGKVGRVIDMAESVGEGAVGEGGDRLGIGGLCQLDERHAASRVNPAGAGQPGARSEEHTSELQSLMRISYAVFCLQKKTTVRK